MPTDNHIPRVTLVILTGHSNQQGKHTGHRLTVLQLLLLDMCRRYGDCDRICCERPIDASTKVPVGKGNLRVKLKQSWFVHHLLSLNWIDKNYQKDNR